MQFRQLIFLLIINIDLVVLLICHEASSVNILTLQNKEYCFVSDNMQYLQL